MSTCFIALGSNSADASAQLKAAAVALDELAFSRVRRRSSIYQTAPWGDLEQPDFLNAVFELHTELAPHALLAALQNIEQSAGRVRATDRRFGPRTLDLDILLYSDMRLQSTDLQLPHPRLHLRAFALVPLLEIAPDISIPGMAKAHDCLRALPAADIAGVQRISTLTWD
jgi:2-amino-4-hydroxy-6-hydroxymethyldihydropteridine diphosphokinase